MSIDYSQLKALVKEAMFTGGGINEPSGPEGIPHRMPAAETDPYDQEQGNEDANRLYDVALTAREAAEQLVEALDDPIFDAAYEHAFKASACLRRALNSLEESGAHPMPQQRVVASPPLMQKYAGGRSGGDNVGSGGIGAMGAMGAEMQEGADLKDFGSGISHAKAVKDKGAAVAKGDVLGGVDDRERKILLQIEDVITQAAEKVDLVKYRPILKTFLTQFLAKIEKDPDVDSSATEIN